ncbi:MAG: hypothetical protein R2796_10760 [Chitinophagaceae bacterium]
MKFLLLLSIILWQQTSLLAQQSLKKYAIEKTGCYYSNYCAADLHLEYSEDSSKVYSGECTTDETTYGVICVQLLRPMNDLKLAEDMMIAYLDYLKSTMNIEKSVGYVKGYRLHKDENTRGVVDYWIDKDADKWKIKAWTNGRFIGLLYAYKSGELSENKVNQFLDSFVFPQN